MSRARVNGLMTSAGGGAPDEAGDPLIGLGSGSRLTRIDGDDGSADVGGASGGEIDDQVRDFRRSAGALERQRLRNLRLYFLPARCIAKRPFRPLLHMADLALGFDPSRVHAHHADAVIHALAPSARVNAISAALPLVPAM